MPRYTFKYCSYIITILKLIILFNVDFTNNPSAYESAAPYTEKTPILKMRPEPWYESSYRTMKFAQAF